MVGVAVSGSRGGYFAALGSLFCFALASIYTTRWRSAPLPGVALISLGGLAAVVGLAAVLMFNSEYLTQRMQTMVAKDVRIYNWEAALDHIRVSPWVGTGAGTHLIYGRLFRRPQIQADPVHAHCDYLELLAEYGAGGRALHGPLLAWPTSGTGSARIPISCGGGSFPPACTGATALPFSLASSAPWRAWPSTLWWISTCTSRGMRLFSPFSSGPWPIRGWNAARILRIAGSPPGRRLLLPTLGVFTLWKGLPQLPFEYYSEKARVSLRDGAFLDAIASAKKARAFVPPARDPGFDQNPPPAPGAFETILGKTGFHPRNPNPYLYEGEANRQLGLRMPDSYLRQSYYEEAAAAFEGGLKIFPQDESMLVRYAQTLDGLERFPEAEALYQRAFALDPHLGALYEYYAGHLAAQGNQAGAEGMARKKEAITHGAVDEDSGASLLPR